MFRTTSKAIIKITKEEKNIAKTGNRLKLFHWISNHVVKNITRLVVLLNY